MPEPMIALARIGAPHGVRGEVRITSFTAEPLAFASYGPLRDAAGRQFEIVKTRANSGTIVAQLKGVSNRDQAAALNGVELLAPRSALPAGDGDDEFYLADLIGLDVVTETGTVFGKVSAVRNFGAGDILEIALAGGQSELFAFTRANFPQVDLPARRMVIRPPASIEAKAEAE